jgi:hypothetical protein
MIVPVYALIACIIAHMPMIRFTLYSLSFMLLLNFQYCRIFANIPPSPRRAERGAANSIPRLPDNFPMVSGLPASEPAAGAALLSESVTPASDSVLGAFRGGGGALPAGPARS